MIRVFSRLSFQSAFRPSPLLPELETVYLFIEHLRDIDEVFDIAYYWSKDPDGSEPMSRGDIAALGLREIQNSDVFFQQIVCDKTMFESLRIFHEMFGIGTSEDIPRFLDLPMATLEWHGNRLLCFAWFNIEKSLGLASNDDPFLEPRMSSGLRLFITGHAKMLSPSTSYSPS